MRTESAGDRPLRNRGCSALLGRSALQPQRKGNGSEGEGGGVVAGGNSDKSFPSDDWDWVFLCLHGTTKHYEAFIRPRECEQRKTKRGGQGGGYVPSLLGFGAGSPEEGASFPLYARD